jgi:hypothetical protein
MDGKIGNMSASSFAGSSANPLPKPLKCFVRLLESREEVFERHSSFKASQVSVADYECSGQTSTSKMAQHIEKVIKLIHEDDH